MQSDDQPGDEETPAANPRARADDYEELPYLSLPAAFTQPAHLAALVTLHGLEAPSADTARVLELGCASGGNIIPLAVRFPNARFVGLDLARRQIEAGRRRVASLGLANIELRQNDLATVDLGSDAFDVIICHGVFSWVPETVREAILRLCAAHLDARGVAVISYNVHPGWHLRQVVRDICLHYAGNQGKPQQRVAKARAALDQLAAAVREGDPYGQILRSEARRLARQPASYVMGEFLAPDNAPCLFTDFVASAARHGLNYLCEADLGASTPEIHDPQIRNQMGVVAASGPLAVEQYVDFLTGRPFRRSVLTRQTARARIPAPILEQLRCLHVAAAIRPDAAGSTDQVAVFRDAAKRSITVEPSVGRTLGRLAAAYPGTLSVDELPDQHQPDTPRLYEALLAMLQRGQATVSSLPLRVDMATDERPRAWGLARAEVAAGQRWVTTLQHMALPLAPPAAFVLSLLNGTRDRAMLKAELAKALQRRDARLADWQADAQVDAVELEELAGRHLQQMLALLAANALLEPKSSG